MDLSQKLVEILSDSNLHTDGSWVVYQRLDEEDDVPVRLFDLNLFTPSAAADEVTEEARAFISELYGSEEDERLEDLREAVGICNLVTIFCQDSLTVVLAEKIKSGIFELLYNTKI